MQTAAVTLPQAGISSRVKRQKSVRTGIHRLFTPFSRQYQQKIDRFTNHDSAIVSIAGDFQTIGQDIQRVQQKVQLELDF